MFIESILNTQNPNELYRLWSSIKYKRVRTPISTDIRLRYTRYITVKNSSTSISRPNIPLIQPPSSAFKNTYNQKYIEQTSRSHATFRPPQNSLRRQSCLPLGTQRTECLKSLLQSSPRFLFSGQFPSSSGDTRIVGGSQTRGIRARPVIALTSEINDLTLSR